MYGLGVMHSLSLTGSANGDIVITEERTSPLANDNDMNYILTVKRKDGTSWETTSFVDARIAQHPAYIRGNCPDGYAVDCEEDAGATIMTRLA